MRRRPPVAGGGEIDWSWLDGVATLGITAGPRRRGTGGGVLSALAARRTLSVETARHAART
jgi:hypothetical protein